jgi:hypothetical protein
MLEAAGLLATYQERSGPSAMAFFDSPLSMGQALVLTVAATASMALRKGTSVRTRTVYAVLCLIQFSALLAAGARAALVGLVIAAAAYGVLEAGHGRLSRTVRLLASSALTTFALGFVTLTSAWSGALGPNAYAWADGLLSGRFAIWNHVSDRLAGRLLLGAGPEPFDSLISWEVMADGRIAPSLTYDQHSILLTWLMSTGAVGLAVFGLAAIVVGVHIVRSVRAADSSSSVRALAAGGAALFVSMLSSWPEPLALLSVSLVVGGLVGNGSLRSRSEPPTLTWRSPVIAVPATTAAIAAVATTLAFVPALNARITTARANDYPQLVSRIEGALQNTHDYSYLTNELTLIERRGSLAMPDQQALALIRDLAEAYPAEAEGRVEIPLLALEILAERAAHLPEDEFWELSRFYADKGLAIDPASGVWKYALARAARIAQREDAPSHIEAALAANPPDSAAIYLRHIP